MAIAYQRYVPDSINIVKINSRRNHVSIEKLSRQPLQINLQSALFCLKKQKVPSDTAVLLECTQPAIGSTRIWSQILRNWRRTPLRMLGTESTGKARKQCGLSRESWIVSPQQWAPRSAAFLLCRVRKNLVTVEKHGHVDYQCEHEKGEQERMKGGIFVISFRGIHTIEAPAVMGTLSSGDRRYRSSSGKRKTGSITHCMSTSRDVHTSWETR